MEEVDKMVKLNLGSGRDIKKGYINVDAHEYKNVDKILDLSAFPWEFEDESVDEIYTSHLIEHIFDQKYFLTECYRILKRGGLLHIKAPHVTAVTSQGNIGHYRGYCLNTFEDYLSKNYYLFEKNMFVTIHKQINWWRMETITHNVPVYTRVILYPMSFIIDSLIRLSPRVFENLWCYWVGGAREVEWKGIKV